MRYAMLLKPHPNVRYRQSLQKLALIELECILDAWNVACERPRVEYLANEPCIVFDAQELEAAAWEAVSGHSAICLAARLREDGTLQPLRRNPPGWMPEDLPHVLKYKGKTNADFTYLMLHCARSASAFAREPGSLSVLDPMCGKGTTLMCALCENYNAIGVDMDAKALREAEDYLARSLKLHRVKHRRTSGALTLPWGGSARWSEYALAPDAQTMRASPLSPSPDSWGRGRTGGAGPSPKLSLGDMRPALWRAARAQGRRHGFLAEQACRARFARLRTRAQKGRSRGVCV